MNLTETLRIALGALLQNRMRALLTTLGIVIGVGAVIALITLGQGVENYVRDQFQSLGANLLIVSSKQPEDDTRTRIEPLTSTDVEALAQPNIAPNLLQAGGQMSVVAFLTAEGENLRTSARGVTANMADILNWEVRDGRFITQEDINRFSRVAVLGEEAVAELYGSAHVNPVGAALRLNNQAFTVIGVMARRGAGFTNDNIAVFVPISTAQTRLQDARYRDTYRVSTIYAQARSETAAPAAEEEIYAYFDAGHHIETEEERDFQITNQASLLESIGQITGLLTVFLGMIAGVSLLVGGIGIMNIMLVTVTERTQEIGLRKAVGARPNDILIQFLMESITLSLIGGAIGILLGGGGAMLIGAVVPDLSVQVSPGAVALATIVSSTIGILFGIYPANRAARLNPIDALRFE
jgi:putative ABC transport system permease protein